MIDLEDLRKRAAKIINTTWAYSWHWGNEPEHRHWTMDAKHDCIKRIAEVESELLDLKRMRKELEKVAPNYIPNARE